MAFADSINSVSDASSDSGGNSAPGGGHVVTGDSSASAYSNTIINGGNGGGVVDIKVDTTVNGQHQSQSIHQDIPPGAQIEIATSSSLHVGGASSQVHIDIHAHVPKTATTSSTQTGSANVHISVGGLNTTSSASSTFASMIQPLLPVQMFFDFFKHIYNWFGMF
jgi:hypothetical protein